MAAARLIAGGLKEQIRRFLPKTMRSHRILAGRLRGYRIVTSWHDYPGAILGRTERPLLEWFEKHVQAGETWLDVGAHYGYTAIALGRRVGPGGRVVAFEPQLTTAGCLARTRDLNHMAQLMVIPVGLGEPESLEVNVLPVVRGMVDRTLSGSGTSSSPFLTARLDWIWGRVSGGHNSIDGIKIDVQGMEIEALEGMTGVLRAFAPRLVVEIHHGVDRRTLFDLLERVGYSREGEPVEPAPSEATAQYLDDRSYAFSPLTRVVSDAR